VQANAPSTASPISVLYIDCAPNVEFDEATDIFAAARQKVIEIAAAQTPPKNILDYRQISYGEGAGIFAGAVDAYIQEFCKGAIIVVDSSNTDFTVAATALLKNADVVVRSR
jgi:hypothetical protein